MHSQLLGDANTRPSIRTDETGLPTARHVASVWKPRVSGEELFAAAHSGRWLAASVRQHWGEFDDEIRELLRALANDLNEDAGGPRALFDSWSDRTCLAWMAFRGRLEPVVEFMNAIELVVEAVEDAIERENPRYESDMGDALKAAEIEADEPGMTIDEFEQWSERVTNNTLRQL